MTVYSAADPVGELAMEASSHRHIGGGGMTVEQLEGFERKGQVGEEGHLRRKCLGRLQGELLALVFEDADPALDASTLTVRERAAAQSAPLIVEPPPFAIELDSGPLLLDAYAVEHPVPAAGHAKDELLHDH